MNIKFFDTIIWGDIIQSMEESVLLLLNIFMIVIIFVASLDLVTKLSMLMIFEISDIRTIYSLAYTVSERYAICRTRVHGEVLVWRGLIDNKPYRRW